MSAPKVVVTINELRTVLAPLRSGRVAMVPTMGTLHEGHLSLVRTACEHARHVVVSVFVNPTQFAPHEDYDAYPCDLESDLAKLESASVPPTSTLVVFAPAAREMYPAGFATTVTVGGPSAGLETDFRPQFFAGVATVVTKLLLAAPLDAALFGEKDYQQLLVVKRLAQDLGLPTEIVGVPTAREADGLAMSSRNAYLSADERQIAGNLNLVLKDVIVRARVDGELRLAEETGKAALLATGFDSVDYVTIRDAGTLDVIDTLARPARVLAAARLGKTRLIDNMVV